MSERHDELRINQIPPGLHTSYRKLPFSLRWSINITSAFVCAALSDCERRWTEPVRCLTWLWLFQTVILASFFRTLLQEIFKAPSRVSTLDLHKKYYLPSALSRLDKGLHYIEFGRDNNEALVHVNHGFGASSLSWLPAVPLVSKQLNATVLGHDAPGFGLTERPSKLVDYLESAERGHDLLQQYDTTKPLWLFGHSMGCRTTLEMALLPHARPVRIVLVAPALYRPQVPLFFVPFLTQYLLRRVVGMPEFWRRGLSALAWGDSSRLRCDDVLRFAWPALLKGWESSLMKFCLAQTNSPNSPQLKQIASADLIQKVLDKGVPIQVITGEKDKVIGYRQVENFFAQFPSVRVTRIPGLGHDPFEEDPQAFCSAIALY